MPAKSKDSCACCSCGSLPLAVAVVAVIAAVFMSLLLSYLISGRSVQPARTITLTASGSASAAPAMAQIQVYLNATGATAAIANSNLSAVADAVNSTIMPLVGGNASLIQTTSYQVSQATNCTYSAAEPYFCISHVLPYYVASEGLEISVTGMGNADKAVMSLSGIPGLQVEGVQATLSTAQQASLEQQALSAALANATNQAQLLAGSGSSIQVENISVQYSQIYYPMAVSASAAGKTLAGGNSSMIFGGSEAVYKSISVVFGIQ